MGKQPTTDLSSSLVIPLGMAADCDPQLIGGKAAKLAELIRTGFQVPDGFCIATSAYERFLSQGELLDVVRMELGRKPLETMRWEEIWDAALRIRAAFLSQPMPQDLGQQITRALERLGAGAAVAVRSSAPGEDTSKRSFAGLHESIIGVTGAKEVLNAVRLVWASLWSDAALLYRQELSLDPINSRMGVLVQKLVDEDRSGVAFGRDPRDARRNHMIVEAVPGPCSGLVDGTVDPDHWVLNRDSGAIVTWRAGQRTTKPSSAPLLENQDLARIQRAVNRIESIFGWPPDMEWTGRDKRFTILQARPITTVVPKSDDKRTWYLTLRPSPERLRLLRDRVADSLIPELAALGERLTAEHLEAYDAPSLAVAIEERAAAVAKWKKIYWDEFIPFAHGVRQLGLYYNDAVHPEDPYEFVKLLAGERMLASERNAILRHLADMVCQDPSLRDAIQLIIKDAVQAGEIPTQLQQITNNIEFIDSLGSLLQEYMDVSYDGLRLSERPDLVLNNLLQMAALSDPAPSTRDIEAPQQDTVTQLERRLLNAVGKAREDEALDILATGRLSWRLRDDDNVLLGRVEGQHLRAIRLGIDRLVASGRLPQGTPVSAEAGEAVRNALLHPAEAPIILPPLIEPETAGRDTDSRQSPRQLVGQPAAPGLAAGRARCIRRAEDLGRFQAGEILVCDAIEPTMTHLVPLAAAVVERRGGMLIHGAIIARELGIPCVNGITRAAEIIDNGELLTVDGYLGIVTVGPPEFDLEGLKSTG